MVPLLLRSRALIFWWLLFHHSGSAVTTRKRYVRSIFALKDIPSQIGRAGDNITESPSEVPETLPEIEVTEPPKTEPPIAVDSENPIESPPTVTPAAEPPLTEAEAPQQEQQQVEATPHQQSENVHCRGTEDGVSESGWEPVDSDLSLESLATEEYLLGPLLKASGVDFCANETVDKFRHQHFRKLPQPQANSTTQWEVNCCISPQEQNMTYFEGTVAPITVDSENRTESPTDSPTTPEITAVESENPLESPTGSPTAKGSENPTESPTNTPTPPEITTVESEDPTDSPTTLEILEIDFENRTESPSEFPMLHDIIDSENTTESPTDTSPTPPETTVIDSENPNESTLDLVTAPPTQLENPTPIEDPDGERAQKPPVDSDGVPLEKPANQTTTEDLEGDVGGGFIAFLVILVVGIFALAFCMMCFSP